MPGRGRGRLIGPGPNSGPPIGSNARTNNTVEGPSSVIDDFEPVPFYTNMYGKISKAQYDRNKTNPKLHPDTAGLDPEFYPGSMPWHVRNQGRIWILRDQRELTYPNRSRSRSKPKKESKSIALPKNEEPVARDFDTVADEIEQSCHVTSLLLWNDYVQHRNDPPDPRRYKTNFFIPNLRPRFPPLPKNANPFWYLPAIASDIFPFDEYGQKLFDTATLSRWRNEPKAKPELLEVQIRQLIILYELDKDLPIYSEQADIGSYGVETPIYTGLPVQSSDQGEGSGSKSVEPDSGFVSIEPEIDPWAGNGDLIPPNEYSWEPYDGTGYVQVLDRVIPNPAYAHTQVELRFR